MSLAQRRTCVLMPGGALVLRMHGAYVRAFSRVRDGAHLEHEVWIAALEGVEEIHRHAVDALGFLGAERVRAQVVRELFEGDGLSLFGLVDGGR